MAVSKTVCGGFVGKMVGVATGAEVAGILLTGAGGAGSFACDGAGGDFEARVRLSAIDGWKIGSKSGICTEAGGSGGEVRGWKITSSCEGEEGLGLDGEWVGEE